MGVEGRGTYTKHNYRLLYNVHYHQINIGTAIIEEAKCI